METANEIKSEFFMINKLISNKLYSLYSYKNKS